MLTKRPRETDHLSLRWRRPSSRCYEDGSRTQTKGRHEGSRDTKAGTTCLGDLGRDGSGQVNKQERSPAIWRFPFLVHGDRDRGQGRVRHEVFIVVESKGPRRSRSETRSTKGSRKDYEVPLRWNKLVTNRISLEVICEWLTYLYMGKMSNSSTPIIYLHGPKLESRQTEV